MRPNTLTRVSFLFVFVVSAAPSLGQISFGPETVIPLPTRPDTVAIGDLDGDLDLDLAVTGETPDKISILVNNGGGSFAAPVVIPTGGGTGPGHITVVDLDGDADLDLAVVLKGIDSVRVYFNNGAATFIAGGTFPVGLTPLHLAAADFDGINGVDLASVNRDSNDVSILLNNGAGSFGPATAVAVDLDPREVTAGNFDGDLDIDLAVTNHDTRTISLLINSGTGTFALGGTLSVGPAVRPDGITARDLDGDTDLDLAVATSGGGFDFATIFLNDGFGAFGAPQNYAVGGINPGSIVASDFDCDGDLDLATGNRDSNTVSWLPNLGNAIFGAPGTMAVGLLPDHVAAADVDGNGTPDLVTTNTDSDDISILTNESATCQPTICGDTFCDPGENVCTCAVDCGDPPVTEIPGGTCTDSVDNDCDGFTDCDDVADCGSDAACMVGGGIVLAPAGNVLVPVRPDTVAIGDLDGDLDLDLAVTGETPDKISILLNNGDGNFAAPIAIPTGGGTGPGHITAVDLDGDTDLDLAVALKGIDSIRVYFNSGAAAFVAGGTFGVGMTPVHLAAADFDGINGVDLACVNRDSGDVSILLNNGTGSFGPAADVAVDLDPREVTAGNFDGDLDIDLAVTNHDTRTISLLVNNGTGTFSLGTTLSVGPAVRPDGITAGDLDGDTDLDLAVATSGGGFDFATIFLNDGLGTFGAPQNFAVGGVNPGSIVASDLDCDGDLDLATGNRDSNTVSWLPNLGNAVFGTPGTTAVGLLPDHVAAADLDGNGTPDLVTANTDSDDISIILNQTAGACGGVARPLPDDAIDITGAVRLCATDADCVVGLNPVSEINCVQAPAGGGGLASCYVRRNKYVSIRPNPNNAGLQSARRVKLITGEVLGWVGPPAQVAVDGPEAAAQWLSRIQATSHYTDWNAAGTVHVGDCAVSPGQTYVIQAVADGADEADEASYSEELVLGTVAAYGDVIGAEIGSPPDRERNFRDISAVVRGFQSIQSEPKVWLDLQGSVAVPEIPEFSDINFGDINRVVGGFQGAVYPFAAPCDCPGQGCF